MCGYEWIAFSWKGRVDCLICRRWLCFFYFGAVRERERELVSFFVAHRCAWTVVVSSSSGAFVFVAFGPS